jgi:hypothetical protein
MPARVVLHVGTMKSATTYLQHAWDGSRGVLASHDILWPGSGLNFAGFADRLAREEHKRPKDGDWPTLADAVSGYAGTVLLSNELLSVRRRSKLAPLVDETRWPLEVVITARDLGRVIPSQWVTGALNRRPTPWSEFIAELMNDNRSHPAVAWFWRRQDLLAIIETWAGLLGRDSVTLVTVPPPDAAPSVVLDRFMSIFDLDSSALAPPPPEPTVGPATAEFARRLGLALPDLPYDTWRQVVNSVRPLLDVDPLEDRVVLDARQLAWATERAKEISVGVASTGIRVVGDVEDLIPRASLAAPAPTPAPTDAELVAVALRTMTRLVGDGGPSPAAG